MELIKLLNIIEIDIDFCSLSYGVAPCTAAIGVTGTKKCFNTFKTCQDQANFTNVPKTLRFGEGTEYFPGDIDAILSLRPNGVSFTPQTIDPGVSLGQRATLTASFEDHPDSDTLTDPYYADRAYNPFDQGTFWGKFRARNPYLIGRPLRWITGKLGQSLAQMETRHFIIESTSGPDTSGTFKIIAKDILKIADGDRAQAPVKSTGVLLAGIDENDTSFTLDPLGIGDIEYPASGSGSIGEEMVTFTRSGDTVTIVRGQYGTEAVEHDADDLFQTALIIDSMSPADVINLLFTGYTQVDPAYIPLAEWQYEVDLYINRVYDAVIAKPTPIEDLIDEMIEQSGLVMWWDDIGAQIKLRSLRPVAATAEVINDDSLLLGSLKITEQPRKRASQVWVSFSQINPLEDLTRESNYASGVLCIDAQSEIDNGQPAIKKIFSRWIPPFARSTALRLGGQILSRYRNPPRKFTFALDRVTSTVALGKGYQLQSWPLQKDTGEQDSCSIIITSLKPQEDQFMVEAEEMLFFTNEDLESAKLIVIDQNSYNINLRTVYDNIYAELAEDEEVNVIIERGVIVGSTTTALYSFDVGEWPSGVTLNLSVFGRIQGKGGDGGRAFNTDSNGHAGGPAFRTTRAITIDNTTGQIWGGGGGGGAGWEERGTSAGGGGGAGYSPGLNGPNIHGGGGINGENPQVPPTTEVGGVASFIDPRHAENVWGGDGGGPGLPGANGLLEAGHTGTGGAAGAAVVGNSNITWTATGDRRGGIS